MSVSSSTEQRAGERSTRELLDELDTLMERMLRLPVEEEPAPPPPPAPPIAVTLTLVEPNESPAEAAACGLAVVASEASACDATIAKPQAAESACDPANAELVHVTEEPLAEIGPGDVIVEDEDALDEASAPSASVPLWGETPTPSQGHVRPRFTPRRVSIVHWPYAWFLRLQQRFHRFTFRLGILGRLVRSQIFQGILGILGLASVLVAIAWLVRDGFRWTW
jgi:hypothetical protein